MAIVVVYDSIFGNTAIIAKAIAAAIESTQPVRLLVAGETKALDVTGIDLLVVGSPTRGFRPTPAIAELVEGLPTIQKDTIRAAAFDTRLDPEEINPAPLRWVVNAGGYAAQRINASLTAKGFTMVEPDAGFLVGGTEGPLKPGELERAAQWARALVA
jgi:flavodoxin